MQMLKLLTDTLVLISGHLLKSYKGITKVTCRLLCNFIGPNIVDHSTFMLVLNLSVEFINWFSFSVSSSVYFWLMTAAWLSMHHGHQLFLVHVLSQSMCDYAGMYDKLTSTGFHRKI